MAAHQVLRLKLLVRFQFPQPYTGVIMERKPAGRKGLSFWKSYSFLLTLVLLVGLTCVSAFAAVGDFTTGEVSMEFRDGRLGQLSPWGTWTALNTTGLSTALNHGVNLAASGGGGMTLDEFTGYFDPWTKVSLGELFKDYFYYRPAFDQYLDADGRIKTLVSTSGMPDEFYLTSLVSLGLRGLRSVMLDNASINHADLTAGFAANHTDLAALLSELTVVNTSVLDFEHVNHTDLAALLSELMVVNTNVVDFERANHIDLTSGFSVNHADLVAVRRQILDSFDSQNLYYLYGSLFSGPSDISLGSFLVGADGKASFSPWNSSSGEIGGTFYGYGLGGLIAELGMPMQYDLAKLRYVLASDQDIEIAKKNEPVKDAIEDNFVGDAPGAVKPGNVDDMAGISNDLQGALNTGANAGDVLGFINGSEGWGFFSQAVADDLHQIPSSAHEEEEDFIHFYDPSVLDAYLSGGVG